MERTTWLTEKRTAASVTGAPVKRRSGAGGSAAGFQLRPNIGLPAACHGPSRVAADSTTGFHTTDHTGMGRTAWSGTPLGSRGAGYG